MIIGSNDNILYQDSYKFQATPSHYFIIHSSLDNIDEMKKTNNKL